DWIGDLAGDTGTILLVDVSTGKKILHIGDSDSEFPDQRFRSAPVLSPDGRFVAYWERPSDRIHVKNIAGEPDADWSPRTSGETPIAFSPDSRTLITRDPSKDILRFWEMATRMQRSAVKIEPDVDSVTLSPNGRALALVKGSAVQFRAIGE